MKSKWLILAVLFPALSLAQGKVKSNVTTMISTGIIMGESTAKPLYQFSGGFTMNRWFGGAGVGYEAYQYKSIPVFADCRYNLGPDRTAFAYANIGYNFATGNEGTNIEMLQGAKFSGGLYMDAGAGCRLRLSTRHRLLLSAGYSHKTMESRVTQVLTCVTNPCPEGPTYVYTYKFGRMIFKLSWEFGAKY